MLGLNKAVEVADHVLGTDGYNGDNIEQTHVSIFGNEFLVCEDNYKLCYHPKEKLRVSRIIFG